MQESDKLFSVFRECVSDASFEENLAKLKKSLQGEKECWAREGVPAIFFAWGWKKIIRIKG